MKTERIYEQDAYCRRFSARVLDCRAAGDGFEVILDRTAFFPEGGGQAADRGTLGGKAVLDVQLRGNAVVHRLAVPLSVGAELEGVIDWETRFSRMQKHTGEHIVSGLIHRLYGLDNVGFHLGSADATLDLNGELTRQQLDEIELLANRAVWENRPVRAWFPSPQERAAMVYRSKKALDGPVRIVEVEGVDCCACCAPHVASTGEIGMIQLLDTLRYKGGVRIHMQCGRDALLAHREYFTQTSAAAAALSVKTGELAGAVARLLEQKDQLTRALKKEQGQRARLWAQTLAPEKACPAFWEGALDGAAAREALAIFRERELCPAALFVGNDEKGYTFTASGGDLSALQAKMREELKAQGGGSKEQIQGRTKATAAEIRAFWATNCPHSDD